jgi:hypothetical protein
MEADNDVTGDSEKVMHTQLCTSDEFLSLSPSPFSEILSSVRPVFVLGSKMNGEEGADRVLKAVLAV